MNDTNVYHHWKVATDEDGTVWLGADKAESGTNVLSSAVLLEAEQILAGIESRPPPAVVVYSAKTNGFVAGADIKEFTAIDNPDEAFELVRRGQSVLDRLEALPCPTIAALNGFALGGGLELALACRFRIMVGDPAATLGLPEVKLGIHPGFGGTVRAIRLVGVFAAMSMMLTGRNVRHKEARRIGLVDQVVPARHLRRAAQLMAKNPPARRSRSLKDRALALKPARRLVAGVLRRQVARKARRQHYPAPYAIIDLWERHGADPAPQMMEAEARSIANLMCTATSRNLVRVFMLQDRLKAQATRRVDGLDHVHVIGAGVMGGDIAAWCALRGMRVSLQDREPRFIAPAIGRAHKLFSKRLRDPRLVQAAVDRLMPDVKGVGVAGADVVIEAIFENTEAKQALYAELVPRMKPDAILATNTSSIRLEELRTGLPDPGRLIGLHFFNPVAMMPLVEVVHGQDTHPDEVEKGLAFAKCIGKLPLACASAPGFVVNRVLMPYLMEAFRIGSEGVDLPMIDKAATDFGMPVGPVELADTVGLDVCLSVSRVFAREFGMEVPERLEGMVKRGDLGRKTGRGFYEWRKGKALKKFDKDAEPPAGLADRMILPMLNEAVACLREGVVTQADLLDAGVIFGTGFAPFTGGPLRYAQTRGIVAVRAALSALAERHGERFTPDAGWSLLAPEEEKEQPAGAQTDGASTAQEP